MASVAELTERFIRLPTHNPGGDEGKLAELLGRELAARAADAVEVVPIEAAGR